MAAQAVLIAVLVVVAASFAVPFVWLERNRWRQRREANALVVGGAVLGGGQGLIAFGIFASVAADLSTPWLLVLPLLSVVGALLALWTALRPTVWTRPALLAAAVLSLGGAFAGALFVVAGVTSFVASLCYLAALSDNPRNLLRRLDPRE